MRTGKRGNGARVESLKSNKNQCFKLCQTIPDILERRFQLSMQCKVIMYFSVCYLLNSGVAAIFGPQSAHTASHVQSICDTMEIPHLETRWDYRLKRESCLVNLYPHPTTLSKVFIQSS